MDSIEIFSMEKPMPKPLYEQFFALMEQAFPTTERRDYEGFLWEYTRREFRSMCYMPNGEFSAVLNFWDFGEFIYVEHFAVQPQLRGQGIGEQLISELKSRTGGRTLVLEAEPPEEEISRRRIGFYQRLGFKLNDYDYIQPPLINGEPPIPLKIMSFPCLLSEKEYAIIQATMYREVYKRKFSVPQNNYNALVRAANSYTIAR